MFGKFHKLLLVTIVASVILLVGELDAYEPLVTVGKPPLYDIFYSPDGQFLATLTTLYVELLDAETLEPVKQIAVEGGNSIQISPDSSLLSISTDEDIQIWHLSSEEFITSIPIKKKRITRNGKFSPDGKYLAFADGDSVFLWHTERREIVRELTGDPEPGSKPSYGQYVKDIAFHPNSDILAVASIRKTISLWDVETGEILSYLDLGNDESYVEALVFSNDGDFLVSKEKPSKLVKRWDMATGKVKSYYGERLHDFVFTSDDQHLLVGGGDGNLHVVQTDTFRGEKIPAIPELPPPNFGNMSRLERVTVHPNGQKFATLINHTRIRIWNAQDFSRIETLYGYSYNHAKALYLPKLNRIITGVWSNVLCFWDATSGELVSKMEFFEDIPVLEAAPDGKRIAFAPYHMANEIWDAGSMKQLQSLERGDPMGGPTTAIAFSPSGRYLGSSGWRGTFIWDTKTGEQINWIRNGWSDVRFILFTPDERQILMVLRDEEKMGFWDVETGELVDETDHIGPMVYVGDDFVQARQQGDTIEVYMFESGERLCEIPDVPGITNDDRSNFFWRNRFHPSGNALAVWDHKGKECKIYNVWTGKLLSTISNIRDLQFTADGDYVFIVDNKQQLGLYRTSEVLGRPVSSVFTPHAFDKITTFGQIKQGQLFQNYPNPFNPETWIPYQLAADSQVITMIYDVSGKLVRILDIGQKEAGLYVNRQKAAYWDGRNQQGESVGSGVYFYQLVTGDDDYSSTKKMIMIR